MCGQLNFVPVSVLIIEITSIAPNMDRWWMGKKMKEPNKKYSKTIGIVSYALKVSVNGVTCVFVAHVKSSGTFESL